MFSSYNIYTDDVHCYIHLNEVLSSINFSFYCGRESLFSMSSSIFFNGSINAETLIEALVLNNKQKL